LEVQLLVLIVALIKFDLAGKSEIAVEMVCLGNICRSPMAAAVLHNKVMKIQAPRIVVSSSGTSDYHVGEGAHKRATDGLLSRLVINK
jgi:protein-tyrosine-phosphatase